MGNPEVCLCDLMVATLACIAPSHHPERQAFPGSDQLSEPPALVFPVTTPTVRLPPVSGCQTEAGCGSTAVSHKTNTWIDGNRQGSSLWRCVGTLQTCFSHDHSASHRTESERSSPPSLSHGAVPSGPTRRTEHSITARAEHSKFHSHKLDTFPSIYRSWRERGKPIVSAARIPPTSRDTPRGTGLAGENPPHPPIQQRTLPIRSAPHSEGALDPEADTQGPNKTNIRARRGLSAVGAFKHSQAMPQWLCQ